MIVEASEVDFAYGGNLYIRYLEKSVDGQIEKGVNIWSAGPVGRVLEYSLNKSEYTEFEFNSSGGSYLTNDFQLNEGVNIVQVRDLETQTVLLKGIVINNENFSVAFHNSLVGHQKGDYIYQLYDNTGNEFEYSLDGGESFYDIIDDIWNNATKCETHYDNEKLYVDKIIIRDKITKEIVYESPEIGEIEEEYIYENGKTTVDFSVNGDAKDETSYTYTINGKSFSGNNISVESDSSINLEAYTDKEFVEQTAEKEIQVKVIKVEKPVIEIDEEDNLVITEGTIQNDELGNVYYSIDDGEYSIYAEKVKLQPGTHIIKAYQITDEYEVKSDIETKEVTIEEIPNNDNSEENNNSGDIDKEENNSSNEGINKEENSNKEEENSTQQTENIDTPKTGDIVISYVLIIFAVILLNIVIKRKTKNKLMK